MIWVSQVGRKSFVFEYRITDEATGRLIAEGCSTQVWFDYAAGESRAVPIRNCDADGGDAEGAHQQNIVGRRK